MQRRNSITKRMGWKSSKTFSNKSRTTFDGRTYVFHDFPRVSKGSYKAKKPFSLMVNIKRPRKICATAAGPSSTSANKSLVRSSSASSAAIHIGSSYWMRFNHRRAAGVQQWCESKFYLCGTAWSSGATYACAWTASCATISCASPAQTPTKSTKKCRLQRKSDKVECETLCPHEFGQWLWVLYICLATFHYDAAYMVL